MDMNQNMGMGGNNEMSGGKSWGGVVAIVIVIALIIVGGLYLWGKEVNKERMTDTSLEAVETANLDADISGSDLSGLDSVGEELAQ